jgi:hypothetical protein
MGVVQGNQHHRVANARCQEVGVRFEHRVIVDTGDMLAELPRACVRFGDRYDAGTIDSVHVVDVLQAHHPGTDHAVANLVTQPGLLGSN